MPWTENKMEVLSVQCASLQGKKNEWYELLPSIP
jgi:hypothetical protein